jgi:hypothetical protein
MHTPANEQHDEKTTFKNLQNRFQDPGVGDDREKPGAPTHIPFFASDAPFLA